MLQRSVTEMRRLPSGRSSRSTITESLRRRLARWIDPDAAAVCVHFFFPDRHAFLHFLDDKAACRECVVTVGGGSGDRDARLADRNEAEPVLEHHARVRPPVLSIP